jgi:hypothetical protein
MIIINTIIALFLYHHQLLEYACCMVIVAFQIIFCAEMHVNDFFLFKKKIIFDISISKKFKIYKLY